MAHVLVLGAGVAGLSTAMLLARQGHDVEVIERDPDAPPPLGEAEQAWENWDRRGVAQFRLPHYALPRWWAVVRAELPEVAAALDAAGAARVNHLVSLLTVRGGPPHPDDERFTTTTARRPVLEAALAHAADAAGLPVRRGVTVTGLVTDGRRPPRVTGVRTADARELSADLVVDCGGRRSALGSWLEAAGARPPRPTRADCGFIYYARHFRSRTGELPPTLATIRQDHESLSVLTLPADAGTWSVVLTVSSRDKALRVLRYPDRWDTAVAAYPLAAHWADGEPLGGVDVMAGLEDRHRPLVSADGPAVTGVVAVGDAWACTNPSLGRGLSMALLHACLLRDVLAEVDALDHRAFACAFAERTAAVLEPLLAATIWYDRHRIAEIDADVAGEQYRTTDRRWYAVKALTAAAIVDDDLLRAQLTIASLLATADEVFGQPRVRDRAFALGADAPQYPLPGPRRADLLAILDR